MKTELFLNANFLLYLVANQCQLTVIEFKESSSNKSGWNIYTKLVEKYKNDETKECAYTILESVDNYSEDKEFQPNDSIYHVQSTGNKTFSLRLISLMGNTYIDRNLLQRPFFHIHMTTSTLPENGQEVLYKHLRNEYKNGKKPMILCVLLPFPSSILEQALINSPQNLTK